MALDTNKISIATHIDTPQTDRVMSLSDEKTATLQAKAASDDEHSMTLLEGLKSHPKAVMWSMLLSTTIIMEGYDIVLVGSLYGQPAFQKRYGRFYDGIGYQIPGPWQVGLSNATTCGTIIGAFGNGWLTQRFGYRKVLIASLALITAFIFIPFFAPSIEVLCVGEILCGIPWGVFATMAPAYASEVCPLALRGHLALYVNLCWAFGQLIAAGVLQGTEPMTTQWAYRIPFAVQWAWPIPLLAILIFAPESPWWLVRQGKIDAARRSLSKLSPKQDAQKIEGTIALIRHTHQVEDQVTSGTSYLDCFKGVDLRRTEIVCVVFAAQVLSGQQLGGSPTYFFQQAGLPTSTSFQFSTGGLGLARVGTIISWWLLNLFGRRSIYVVGLGLLAVLMFVIGFIEVGTNSEGGSYAMGSVVLIWLFVYYLTIGPICYAIISETSSMRLRAKSVFLYRISYYITQIVGYTAEPYMVNPTEGNLKGKTGFVWGATCFLCFIWAIFRLPETKGRTYEELDILFARGVSARKFKSASVDAYEGDVLHERQ